MLDTRGRKYIEGLIQLTAKTFIRLGLSPNQITGLAFVIGLCVPLAYLWHEGESVVFAVVLLWLSGLLDAADGAAARLLNKSSSLGTLLDILFDRVVECAVIIGIAYLHSEALFPIVILMSAIICSMTIFLTTGALTQNTGYKSFRYQAGLAERTEGFIMLTGMMLFPQQVVLLTWIFTGLISVTIIQRLRETLSLFRELESKKPR